ncbi:hypothetical protein AQEC111735_03095 [Aquirufa ecclesiirivi]
MNSIIFSWRSCASLLYMHILYVAHLILDEYSFYHDLVNYNQILFTTIFVILPILIYIKWVFGKENFVSNQWSLIYSILLLMILFSFKIFIPEYILFQLGFSFVNLLIFGIFKKSLNQSKIEN